MCVMMGVLATGVCAIPEVGGVGRRRSSELGPLQEEGGGGQQRQAPGPGPAASGGATYHFHQGGLRGPLVRAVATRLPHHGLPLAGGLSVGCGEREREARVRGSAAEQLVDQHKLRFKTVYRRVKSPVYRKWRQTKRKTI